MITTLPLANIMEELHKARIPTDCITNSKISKDKQHITIHYINPFIPGITRID